jgi:hypothetical protein
MRRQSSRAAGRRARSVASSHKVAYVSSSSGGGGGGASVPLEDPPTAATARAAAAAAVAVESVGGRRRTVTLPLAGPSPPGCTSASTDMRPGAFITSRSEQLQRGHGGQREMQGAKGVAARTVKLCDTAPHSPRQPYARSLADALVALERRLEFGEQLREVLGLRGGHLGQRRVRRARKDLQRHLLLLRWEVQQLACRSKVGVRRGPAEDVAASGV